MRPNHQLCFEHCVIFIGKKVCSCVLSFVNYVFELFDLSRSLTVVATSERQVFMVEELVELSRSIIVAKG